MKTLIVSVFALGFIGVIANPVSKQTIQSEHKYSPQVESSDSKTKHDAVINTNNKGGQEQKKDTLLIETLQSPNTVSDKDESKQEIIIEVQRKPTDDSSKILDENCEQELKKNESIENPDLSKDEKVEIIIEENVEEPIDNDFQPQGSFAGVPTLLDSPPLPGLNIEETHLPGAMVDSELSAQLPGFFEGVQITGDFGSVSEIPGFVAESPELPSLIGDIPQIPGITQLPGLVDNHPQFPSFMEGIPQLPGFLENDPESIESDEDNMVIDKDYFQDDMQKVEHEIMETAAGFVPTPLVFRKKQKPRRRFAIRRHFRRNPYRRHQMINLYPYSYYAFYRPSSLRYY